MSNKPTPEQVAALRAQMDPTYTIIISAQQLKHLHAAMEAYATSICTEEDLDEFGNDVPTTLNDMLQDKLAPSPAINSFVI